MHDWRRVEAGIYHDFHQVWTAEIRRVLNAGLLPPDFYALVEQFVAGRGPDVLALRCFDGDGGEPGGGTATLTRTRPKASHQARSAADHYRRKANTIAIRHVSGDLVVAMVEIVSPCNKDSRHAFEGFVRKAQDLLAQGIHLLIVDPFPPGRRDPGGVHAAIWEMLEDVPAFVPPPERPLTFAAYQCGEDTTAYIESLAVGEPLPDMPLFLEPDGHILVPLEKTFLAAWESVPRRWRRVIAPE